jgi:hypothetical protein
MSIKIDIVFGGYLKVREYFLLDEIISVNIILNHVDIFRPLPISFVHVLGCSFHM